MRTASNLRALAVSLSFAAGLSAHAGSITIESDAGTLGAALGSGTPTSGAQTALDNGDTTGLTFSPVSVGAFGTFTSVPPSGPGGAEVVNIAPGDGENGFFEDTFTLPGGFSGASLSGVGNVDDSGNVWLNGHLLTGSQELTEFGNFGFSTSDDSFFASGQNTLLISDDNSGGGPSGTAFFATIDYSTPGTVPDSASGLPLCFTLVCTGMAAIRRKIARRA